MNFAFFFSFYSCLNCFFNNEKTKILKNSANERPIKNLFNLFLGVGVGNVFQLNLSMPNTQTRNIIITNIRS